MNEWLFVTAALAGLLAIANFLALRRPAERDGSKEIDPLPEEDELELTWPIAS